MQSLTKGVLHDIIKLINLAISLWLGKHFREKLWSASSRLFFYTTFKIRHIKAIKPPSLLDNYRFYGLKC